MTVTPCKPRLLDVAGGERGCLVGKDRSALYRLINTAAAVGNERVSVDEAAWNFLALCRLRQADDEKLRETMLRVATTECMKIAKSKEAVAVFLGITKHRVKGLLE